MIIAHIDHGKSTLADRFLEITGTIEKRRMREQFLDMNPLEREKGITIKMAPVRMKYAGYILNLIDTPGHVDFTYEVSRALAAVEGAILLVDATQGVQAQTLSNMHLAQKENLAIIPVLNKIDLSSAEVEKTMEELSLLLSVKPDDIFKISAKTGEGVERVLAAIISEVPPPEAKFKDLNTEKLKDPPLRALIFDSHYDSYQGIVAHIRIFDGRITRGEKIKFLANGTECEALETGVFLPGKTRQDELVEGEIGYVATGIKELELVRVGDTITKFKYLNIETSKVGPLPGYKEPLPMVYASIFPENQDDYEILRDSLKKLKLNDASLHFEPEDSSAALGRGFRAGFLGMLHIEIVSERLRREYGLKLIFSNPSVAFRVVKRGGEILTIYSASKMPGAYDIGLLEEPEIAAEIISPARFLGALTTLVHEREGNVTDTVSLGPERIHIKFRAPLREIIVDFYDRLKSLTQGFASMSYEVSGWKTSDLARLDILVAGEKIWAFSEIVPREKIYLIARERVTKLKELLPRELFQVAIQAETDGRIIARETIPAMKKDVTGYLYGGDRTRKMKLWKKQQKGKKKLKEMGRVEIPAEVFIKMLKSR